MSLADNELECPICVLNGGQDNAFNAWYYTLQPTDHMWRHLRWDGEGQRFRRCWCKKLLLNLKEFEDHLAELRCDAVSHYHAYRTKVAS